MVLLAGPGTARAAASCAGQNKPITAESLLRAERTMLCLVNVYRTDEGLNALAHDSSLRRAARGHGEDMVARQYFSHTSPEGRDPHDRAVAAGYPSDAGVGENIAADSSATPQSLFTLWRESSSHNENMLDPGWATAGMGLAAGIPEPPGPDGATGTQLFGTARTGAMLPVPRQGCLERRPRSQRRSSPSSGGTAPSPIVR